MPLSHNTVNTPKTKKSKRRTPREAQRQERGLRTCCACREKAPRDKLLRFVVDSDDELWLDRHLKAPGRGAHLCYRRECVERAMKRNAFSASFKRAVRTPTLDELLRTLVEAQLDKISDLIALAQRRRILISGLNMLESAQSVAQSETRAETQSEIQSGAQSGAQRSREPSINCLIFASDIAEGSKARLARRQASAQAPAVSPPLFSEEADAWCSSQDESWAAWRASLSDRWSSERLGALIGKPSRVALGVADADHAQRLNLEIQRILQVLVAS